MKGFCCLLLIGSFLLLQCGKETSIFKFITSKKDLTAFDAQLSLAQSAYDRGDLKNALKYGQRAYKLGPKSESAAIVLGYTYLGLAGFGPFELIKKMIAKQDEEKNTSTSGSEEASNTASPTASSAPTTATNSADTLGNLSTIIGLTDDEFNYLGTMDKTVAELPVIIPVCAGKARESIERLLYINKAISITCKFVHKDVRIFDDERHQCETLDYKPSYQGKMHFLWVLSHLVEALIFQKVVSYSTTGDGKTNLQQRVERMQNIEITSPDKLTGFIEEMNVLAETVNKIIPIGDCSEEFPQTQFKALLNDMLAVSNGFRVMPGVPPDLSDSIVESMRKIQDIQNQGSKIESSKQQAAAFKEDFTKNISSLLSEKLSTLNSQDLSQDQLTSLCGSYSSIQGSGSQAPKLCREG